jgi:hypothetical protein
MQQRANKKAKEVIPIVTKRKNILLNNETQTPFLAFTISYPITKQFSPESKPYVGSIIALNVVFKRSNTLSNLVERAPILETRGATSTFDEYRLTYFLIPVDESLLGLSQF